MRRWMGLFLSIVLIISLCACGKTDSFTKNNSNHKKTAIKEKENTTTENSHILIAYFTVPENVDTSGVDAVAGASIVVKENENIGNTEYIARIVKETIGGDLFRIETKDSYPLDHDILVDQAAEEQDQDLRPELSSHVENFKQYDTIILGFPNWWADLPMPVYSFLEEYDFDAKTIIPFVTHGGSGFSSILNTISKLQPNAYVSDNTFSLSREKVANGEAKAKEWAESLGLNVKPE